MNFWTPSKKLKPRLVKNGLDWVCAIDARQVPWMDGGFAVVTDAWRVGRHPDPLEAYEAWNRPKKAGLAP